jgi:hypothetical protein
MSFLGNVIEHLELGDTNCLLIIYSNFVIQIGTIASIVGGELSKSRQRK